MYVTLVSGDVGTPGGPDVTCYSLTQGEKVLVLNGEERIVVQKIDGHLVVDFGGQHWFPGTVKS